MEPNVKGGLYRITNRINGKCYIGISKVSVEKRWSAHKSNAARGFDSALYNAIRKYGVEAFSIEHLVIAEWGDYLKQLEKDAIKAYSTIAPNGYNLTEGGDGAVGMVPEVIEKIKIGRKANPPKITEEGSKRISESCKKYWSDPTHKASRSAAIKEALNNPDVKEKHKKAIKDALKTDERREKKREVSKKLWCEAEYRNKVNAAAKAGMQTEQARKNRSEAAKEAWAKRKAA